MIATRSTSLVPTAIILGICLVASPAWAEKAADIDQIGRVDQNSSDIEPPSASIAPTNKGRIENVPSKSDNKPLDQVAPPPSPKRQARLPQTKSERDLCEEIRAKRRLAIQGLDCSRSQLDSLRTRELSPEEALSKEQPGGDALAGQDIPVPDKSVPPIAIITH